MIQNSRLIIVSRTDHYEIVGDVTHHVPSSLIPLKYSFIPRMTNAKKEEIKKSLIIFKTYHLHCFMKLFTELSIVR